MSVCDDIRGQGETTLDRCGGLAPRNVGRLTLMLFAALCAVGTSRPAAAGIVYDAISPVSDGWLGGPFQMTDIEFGSTPAPLTNLQVRLTRNGGATPNGLLAVTIWSGHVDPAEGPIAVLGQASAVIPAFAGDFYLLDVPLPQIAATPNIWLQIEQNQSVGFPGSSFSGPIVGSTTRRFAFPQQNGSWQVWPAGFYQLLWQVQITSVPTPGTGLCSLALCQVAMLRRRRAHPL